mmetsp:Transcript_8228/g.11673  ORF Transcript_8228/g.11673 Transcript_8228/m.11673 type:complete len:220 (+) Transcript_8228:505-1164(+)
MQQPGEPSPERLQLLLALLHKLAVLTPYELAFRKLNALIVHALSYRAPESPHKGEVLGHPPLGPRSADLEEVAEGVNSSVVEHINQAHCVPEADTALVLKGAEEFRAVPSVDFDPLHLHVRVEVLHPDPPPALTPTALLAFALLRVLSEDDDTGIKVVSLFHLDLSPAAPLYCLQHVGIHQIHALRLGARGDVEASPDLAVFENEEALHYGELPSAMLP